VEEHLLPRAAPLAALVLVADLTRLSWQEVQQHDEAVVALPVESQHSVILFLIVEASFGQLPSALVDLRVGSRAFA
jgi:hypothetical protein